MAQSNGIIDRWSFKEFFMSHGRKIKRVPCTNSETNESFTMLAFGITDSDRKFVGFSQNLGELSSSQINSLKNDLQVVELEVSAETAARRRAKGQQVESYRLCRKGEEPWEEVEITGW